VIGALVVGAAVAIWITRDDDGGIALPSWRMPELNLPQVSMPDISMPDFELRGRQTDQPAQVPDMIASDDGAMTSHAADAAPTARAVPFEVCATILVETGNRIGNEPVLVEDSAQRRVARYALPQGHLTITCARDNTMLIAQGS
jgi:hypothetical protein